VTVIDYHLPASLPEALALLAEHGPDLLVLAGGTVAMPLVNEGISLPSRVMGLRHAGLDRIERTDDVLRVGATATLTALAARDEVPVVASAAARTASWAVRNLATVGGNLFTPPPGGDVAVALLAADAAVELTGASGTRVVPLEAFHTGFMTTDLAADELVTALLVPVTGDPGVFHKFGRRQGSTPAVVTVAATVRMDGDRVAAARVALSAVGPHPIRARAAEDALVGTPFDEAAIAAAASAAQAAGDPFTDAVASAWYRRRVAGVITGRALTELAGRARKGA
jgi:CO/xanthine dehydrogenase FAD-binding subunit